MKNLVITALCFAVVGCDFGQVDSGSSETQTQVEALRQNSEAVRLRINLAHLGDLGEDFVYEGWLITSNGPVSTGRFNLQSDRKTNHMKIRSNLAERATQFVLTIEPRHGDAPGPSATKVLASHAFAEAGALFQQGFAALSIDSPQALNTNFENTSGGYILETPSSADSSDYNQGIWFLDPAAGPGASLNLPILPAGWVYEGWVVGDEGPVSTGRFYDTVGEDSDGKGPTAGPDGFPPFPGQDYITPAMNLIGSAAVITVEPMPDNSRAPFFMKPLIDGNIEDVGPGTVQSLDFQPDTMPQGVILFW